MRKHRSYSIEFKRQVAQEYLAGETLHGISAGLVESLARAHVALHFDFRDGPKRQVRRRGNKAPIDREAANALFAYAVDGGATLVIAHTAPTANASTRVLAKCGFEFRGDVVDPDDGLVWRWERSP